MLNARWLAGGWGLEQDRNARETDPEQNIVVPWEGLAEAQVRPREGGSVTLVGWGHSVRAVMLKGITGSHSGQDVLILLLETCHILFSLWVMNKMTSYFKLCGLPSVTKLELIGPLIVCESGTLLGKGRMSD